MRALQLSLLPYPIALVAAVGLGVATYFRTPEPVTYRSTWCPSPDQRASVPPGMGPDELLDRLREARERARELLGDGPEAREVDRLLLELASDVDLARIPLEEARP